MYKEHCENLKAIEKAINIIEKDINKAIRYKRNEEEKVYTQLLCALMVSWLEIRLLKLINETLDNKNKNSKKIFTKEQMEKILKSNSLLNKWIISLNIAAQKTYKIKLFKNLIKVKNYNNQKTFELKHKLIIDILENEISPIITTRNKIDHGQLICAYNNFSNSVSPKNTIELKNINIVSLRSKKAIFKNISNIIHDLTVSQKAFERDFDVYFKRIEEYYSNATKINYQKYKKILIEKQERYKMKP